MWQHQLHQPATRLMSSCTATPFRRRVNWRMIATKICDQHMIFDVSVCWYPNGLISKYCSRLPNKEPQWTVDIFSRSFESCFNITTFIINLTRVTVNQLNRGNPWPRPGLEVLDLGGFDRQSILHLKSSPDRCESVLLWKLHFGNRGWQEAEDEGWRRWWWWWWLQVLCSPLSKTDLRHFKTITILHHFAFEYCSIDVCWAWCERPHWAKKPGRWTVESSVSPRMTSFVYGSI